MKHEDDLIDLRPLDEGDLRRLDEGDVQGEHPVAFVVIGWEDDERQREAVIAYGLEQDLYDRTLALIQKPNTGIAWGVTVLNGEPLTERDEGVEHGDLYLFVKNEDEEILISGLHPGEQAVLDGEIWFTVAGEDEEEKEHDGKHFSVECPEDFVGWAAEQAEAMAA